MRRVVSDQVKVTRIGYFLTGFAVACWAPLIPIIEHNLSLSTEMIASLVFSFGIGAVAGMFLAGLALQSIGFKITYTITSLTTVLTIAAVSLMPCYEVVLISVILFGISIGCLEVAINVFAAYVERKYNLLLMPILFAYYSLGEVVGAVLMIILLTLKLTPELSIISLTTIIYLISAYYIPRIMSIHSENKQENRTFAKPVQPVISLALIIAFTYILGGAILDWSGLYLTQKADIPLNLASIGYAIEDEVAE